MSPLAPEPGPRRRRADAVHNTQAILDAASAVLSERPDASLAVVAEVAGISRKTLYAHFPSRELLINALIERAAARVVAALDAADLESGPADAALVRLMEAGWAGMDADPFLLHLATPPVSPEQDRERHAPILERLRAVIERGKREGDVAPDLPIGWVLTAVLALGHAAGEEVRAGRMTSTEAIETLRLSIPRLVRPMPPGRRDR
ncbi:TetR/AcrR family transcriptional regulator [Catenulispora sp. NF23]|uniref:TetR/AcrR family transcriptional regulator n=1 Tax=Catenulispora pinistramenti TaxID=2705254 RepID=UPI001BAAC866|nr:TetR/AcrR family transcriptional regulator [Catenulispora pinistramenti]MBS2534592.1 TetR/AcrR family transcriptional regulator [Catenulispora pinistramenti]